MPTIAAPIIIFALQQLIEKAPGLAVKIRAIFAKADVTPADWEALIKDSENESFFDVVPNSRLPRP